MSFFKVCMDLQYNDTELLWTFLAQIHYTLVKSSTSKCKFSDLPLLAIKSTKFLMLFLEPRVSFSSNFASLFSVMGHNSSIHFHLKRYMLWTKRVHQSANCQSSSNCKLPSTARMKVNQIPYFIFQPTSQFSFNFYISVMTHNFYKTLSLKHYMLWTKRAHQSTTFQTFEWSNESSSSCHFWNHKGLFKFCTTVQCLER